MNAELVEQNWGWKQGSISDGTALHCHNNQDLSCAFLTSEICIGRMGYWLGSEMSGSSGIAAIHNSSMRGVLPKACSFIQHPAIVLCVTPK